MIRLALLLTLLTFVGHSKLPVWRARITKSFYVQCLKTTPDVKTKSEIQSLVCGRTLRNSTDQNSWKNLGLIHILVVSGGHLSVLAALLMHIVRSRRKRFLIGTVLTLFCLANQLQPPVLRALFEWSFRSVLGRRGWRSPEVSLMSTWFALPFSSTIYDLLSLALSFFASVAVEQTARTLHRRPILSLVALQVAVWWILLPLLFTLGLPHPLTSMTNLVLAPLLGATLIPFAMVTWASGLFPNLSGNAADPVGLGFLFDIAWSALSRFIHWLAEVLPAASPKLQGARPLLFGYEISGILLITLFCGTCALLIRSRRERRREGISKSRLVPITMIATALLLGIAVHREIANRISGL